MTIFFSSKSTEYAWLSNFAPFGFLEGTTFWPTVEHYFQAAKFTDPAYQERIWKCKHPAEAKKLGRTRAIPLRPDWTTVREDVILYALRRKFEHPMLRMLLIETKDRILVEDAPWDDYWGIGSHRKGQNRMGHLLMQIRSELR